MLFRSSGKQTRIEHCNRNKFRVTDKRQCGRPMLTATRIGSWHRGWSPRGATGVNAWSSPIPQVDMGGVSKLLAWLGGFRDALSCYPLSGAFKGSIIN
jgi:hypothetical protein